jgi:aminobenzoyl-glutamate utilization protein B
MLRARPDGRPYPGWVGNALGGIPATIDPTVDCAARTIAGTLLDVLTTPALAEEARAEFARRTTGPHRIEPLLEPGFEAPVDLPWPEYVTTPRGDGWMNPYGV